MDRVELLIGVAQIAITLAGFSGVVVAFGSRGEGRWLPGDKLRLTFLLEASFTAGGFALLSLLALSTLENEALTWAVMSSSWALFMLGSLFVSRRRITRDTDSKGDIDRFANGITTTAFLVLIALQFANVLLWREIHPFFAALLLNLVGAAMQFARLIRSAFH